MNAVGDADATSANAGGAGVEGGRGRSRADVLRARAQVGRGQMRTCFEDMRNTFLTWHD